MFYSKEYEEFEYFSIGSLAIISIINYIYAICMKPEFADLPEEKTEEQFFNLLQNAIDRPNEKICAYC